MKNLIIKRIVKNLTKKNKVWENFSLLKKTLRYTETAFPKKKKEILKYGNKF